MKSYKACAPNETVSRISRLLKQADIPWRFTHEISSLNNLYHSCRVILGEEKLLPFDIGSNGKGKSRDFSRASALAELMERLQNNTLFYTAQQLCSAQTLKGGGYTAFYEKMRDLGLIADFIYAPDEHFVDDPQQIERLLRAYVNAASLDFFIRHYSKSGLHTVPFYSLTTGAVEHLPFEPIFLNIGTNGMCAGNTPLEAILQGICEIFERYALRRFFSENIKFPNIPHEYFKGTDMYDTLKRVEKESSMELIVKDCSLGLGIPIIGLLIIDRARMEYQFRIGVDTRSHIALERALSELCQGTENIKMLPIDLREQVNIIEDSKQNIKSLRYVLYRPETAAKHPASLFANSSSYEFVPYSDEWGRSDSKDFSMILEILKNHGINLYIRDVSFLGFPAYYIYAPGLSEVNNHLNSEYLALTRERRQHFFNARHIDTTSARENYGISQNILSCYHQTSTLFIPNKKDSWMSGNKQLLQALICYRGNMKDDALKIMTHLLSSARTSNERLLYSCLRDMMEYPAGKYGHQFIFGIYPKNIINFAIHCLNDPLNKLFKIGPCFDCEHCPVSSDCAIIPYLTLYSKISHLYRANTPSQVELSSIFAERHV